MDIGFGGNNYYRLKYILSALRIINHKPCRSYSPFTNNLHFNSHFQSNMLEYISKTVQRCPCPSRLHSVECVPCVCGTANTTDRSKGVVCVSQPESLKRPNQPPPPPQSHPPHQTQPAAFRKAADRSRSVLLAAHSLTTATAEEPLTVTTSA